MWRHSAASLFAFFLLGATTQAQAGYGLNSPAKGAQSAGFADAVLAVTNDTDALNINPAGLSAIEASRFDAMLEPAYWLSHHKDDQGGKSHPRRELAIATGGYAQRLNERWVAGLVFAVQGGAGFAYEDLPNAMGAPDDVSALFGSFKIAPGASWQITERLTLGLSAGLVYSSARQKLLPKTSNAFFNGFRLDGLEGFSTNARAGLLFELNPQWTFAAVYATKTPIRLKNGRMTLDRSFSGQAPLVYEDVSLRGLNFAPEISLGFAFRPDERWLLSGNVSRLDWSSALKTSRLHATKPNDDTAAPTRDMPLPLNFRDHYMVALGGQYQWTPATALRAGVGYARNPQSKESLTPALNLVADRTITAGFAHRFGRGWEFSGAALWQPTNTVNYDSPLFADGAQEGFGALALYFGLGRNWGQR